MQNIHKPQDTDPNVNLGDSGAVARDSDTMETLEPGINAMPDSPSSQADAGLIDPTRNDTALDADFDAAPVSPEIPMSDLNYDKPQLHSPVMADMNAPGEIDVEELDEESVRDLLPPDARLDPIED